MKLRLDDKHENFKQPTTGWMVVVCRLEEALHRRTLLARARTGGRRAVGDLVIAFLCQFDANHMVLLKLISSHPACFSTMLVYLPEMTALTVLLTTSLTSLISPLHSTSPLALTAE